MTMPTIKNAELNRLREALRLTLSVNPQRTQRDISHYKQVKNALETLRYATSLLVVEKRFIRG